MHQPKLQHPLLWQNSAALQEKLVLSFFMQSFSHYIVLYIYTLSTVS